MNYLDKEGLTKFKRDQIFMQHKVVDQHLKILILYVTESGRSCCRISDLGRLKEMAAWPGQRAGIINIWSRVESVVTRAQGDVTGMVRPRRRVMR